MFENDLAMFKIQLKIALKERFYFVYTLIVPVFMVFINKTQDFQDNESLYIYWSYIVVTTVFNGFLINIIRLRESGFFKTLTYLMGSKHSIVLSNILVQVIVIQSEIFLFNLTVTLLITHISLVTFVYAFLATFLAAFLVMSMLSIFLILQVKQSSFNILSGGFFVLGIVLLGSHPQGIFEYLSTFFNPFQFVYGLYIAPCTSWQFISLIFMGIISYLSMGVLIFKNISIKRCLKKG